MTEEEADTRRENGRADGLEEWRASYSRKEEGEEMCRIGTKDERKKGDSENE